MTTILPIEADIEQPANDGKEKEETHVPHRPILMKSDSDLFESSPWLQRWLGCDFPLLPQEAMEAYHKHHLYSVNPFIFIPVLVLFLLFLVFRSGILTGLHEIHTSDRNQTIVIIIAVICVLVAFIFLGLYLTVHALRLKGRHEMLADLTSQLKHLPFRLEESIFFLAVCSWSLFLIARVLKGIPLRIQQKSIHNQP